MMVRTRVPESSNRRSTRAWCGHETVARRPAFDTPWRERICCCCFFRARSSGMSRSWSNAYPEPPETMRTGLPLRGSLGTIAARLARLLLSTHAEGESDAMVAMVGPGDYTQIETANLQFITLCQPHLVAGAQRRHAEASCCWHLLPSLGGR